MLPSILLPQSSLICTSCTKTSPLFEGKVSEYEFFCSKENCQCAMFEKFGFSAELVEKVGFPTGLPKIITKSALLIFEGKKVLFVRTKGNSKFYISGGKIEEHETDVDALTREIKEKLGLIIEKASKIVNFFGPADTDKAGVLVEIRTFFGRFSGVPKLSSEIEEMVWMSSKNSDKTTQTGRLILGWLKKNELIS